MSADARLMPTARFDRYIRDQIKDAASTYLAFKIGPEEYHTRHLWIDSLNTDYIRARIKLYGQGYLPAPPF